MALLSRKEALFQRISCIATDILFLCSVFEQMAELEDLLPEQIYQNRKKINIPQALSEFPALDYGCCCLFWVGENYLIFFWLLIKKPRLFQDVAQMHITGLWQNQPLNSILSHIDLSYCLLFDQTSILKWDVYPNMWVSAVTQATFCT